MTLAVKGMLPAQSAGSPDAEEAQGRQRRAASARGAAARRSGDLDHGERAAITVRAAQELRGTRVSARPAAAKSGSTAARWISSSGAKRHDDRSSAAGSRELGAIRYQRDRHAAAARPGQAGAIRHGITRALMQFDESAASAAAAAGFVTRDAREVERKKVGLRKARRATQFSKR